MRPLDRRTVLKGAAAVASISTGRQSHAQSSFPSRPIKWICFQAAGGSMVMLAKGNRSRQVRDACRAYGGFYLGSVGGPALSLAGLLELEVSDLARAREDGLARFL